MLLVVIAGMNFLHALAIVSITSLEPPLVKLLIFPVGANVMLGINFLAIIVIICLYIGFMGEIRKSNIASTDELTGVLNRRSGMEMMEYHLSNAIREKSRLSIVFIDIDQLKKVNDNLGHTIGDQVITTTIDIINNNVREYDITFRLGGDEFIIILPHCPHLEAEQIMRRVCTDLELNNRANNIFKCQFSYGIVETNQRKQLSVDEMIKESDYRMYIQKNTKSNYSEEVKS